MMFPRCGTLLTYGSALVTRMLRCPALGRMGLFDFEAPRKAAPAAAADVARAAESAGPRASDSAALTASFSPRDLHPARCAPGTPRARTRWYTTSTSA